ncbi:MULTISPECIES: hypothetical protein [Pseudomonas]|uniref:hypothetical protein n=1 Tax=Pseudomonas TaxID=286 RepID=UPI0015A2C9A2|nr:hypothetical protein [Pseudomonas gingeri]NVZ99449.1 hypothetical protein [Pseudomonas gingeri]NWA15529.1 hypothetical protein [Pseudomonas gingeri]NWA56756.1 hypothetical protein [Pseudomonas gingeri]NWA95250.1 hypothetical protein [Pseudomonas gingeri]NWB05332.1 hypothetical protein [Pseudomonas gingeri]
MSELDENWVPGFGDIVTWFAVDKFGRVAVMVNNCFGQLPKVLLKTVDLETELDRISEYIWGESSEFPDIPANKGGETRLDCYSFATYRDTSRSEVEGIVLQGSFLSASEYSLPSTRGYFVFHAVEGDRIGADHPVGYDGASTMGDYFRYLVPTVHAQINDIPEPLRRFFVVSSDVDFEKDRFFESDRLNDFFVSMYPG